MKSMIAVAVLLFLATATLGIGAAPAVAADGCTCHTVEPLTAPAPHDPYVASISDCTTCHVGWTLPHPTALEPNLTVKVSGREFFATLGGGLSIPWVPLANVRVYPQMKPADASDWTTLGPWLPSEHLVTGETGMWGMTVAKGWPPAGTSLRAISEGVVGPPVVMPTLSGPFERPAPTLTLRLYGLTHGAIARGHTVTAKGQALPTELAGQKVQLRVQRWMYGMAHTIKIWRTVMSATRTIGAAGDYSRRYSPKATGKYRVRTFMDATAAYRSVTTDWRYFRMK